MSGGQRHLSIPGLQAAQTWQLLRRARRSSYAAPETTRSNQQRSLRALLQHAYQNVPLYRELYREAGFQPDDFRDLNDLEHIPVLSKERLKDAGRDALDLGIEPENCVVVSTSGSTGTPMQIFLGPHEVNWQRAVAWRVLFENGFRWRNRTLEIRKTIGPSFLVQRFGLAPKDWSEITEPPERWAELLAKRQHEVVVAGASTLVALAEAYQEQNLPRAPRLIVSDAETLAPSARNTIREGLGSDPVDVYGLVELSNFAWQCPERNTFHISADSHVVEVVESEELPPKLGRVIATDLGMWTMPIIRYDTGDLAERGDGSCPCRRTLPTLSRVIGRAVDSVKLPSGRRLPWPFFHEVLGGFTKLKRWRIHQSRRDAIRIELVVDDQETMLFEEIHAALRDQMPETLHIELVRREKISDPLPDKTRMIVSDC